MNTQRFSCTPMRDNQHPGIKKSGINCELKANLSVRFSVLQLSAGGSALKTEHTRKYPCHTTEAFLYQKICMPRF
ncbi:MAG: hypothetical protein DRI57_23850 [Deltaproteobacteria bacterium]|nr:MAG: hypothetical protein DRI57_23850 [Deltaproteobacteria bacterium]